MSTRPGCASTAPFSTACLDHTWRADWSRSFWQWRKTFLNSGYIFFLSWVAVHILWNFAAKKHAASHWFHLKTSEPIVGIGVLNQVDWISILYTVCLKGNGRRTYIEGTLPPIPKHRRAFSKQSTEYHHQSLKANNIFFFLRGDGLRLGGLAILLLGNNR